MAESSDVSTLPGLSLQVLFRQTKVAALRDLIGSATMEVLLNLDAGLAERERLAELAAKIINPSEALRDPSRRDLIINILPLQKARELAQRLGVTSGRELYSDLRRAASESSALPELFSFFGVVHDVRAPMETLPDIARTLAGYPLFDHQRRVASRVERLLAQHPRKLVLHMPTGSGKTRTAMHVIARHLITHEPTIVCWLAQNAELLEQAAGEFAAAWNKLGNRHLNTVRFWGHRNPDILQIRDGVIVAGLAKMHAIDNRDPQTVLRLADRISLVIIDEAHQAIAPTYASVLSALYTKRSSTGLLGLTATPGRTWSNISEDQALSEFFDGIKVTLDVEGYSDPIAFLIENEYLAKPVFRTLNSEAGVRLSESDILELSSTIDVPDAILESLGADTQRNLKILVELEELVKRHSRIIVFAPSVESARLLAAILTVRGHDSEVVTGATPPSERDRIIRRFRSNASQAMILCNFGVLTTGFDAPAISAALIARPTKSLVLFSQMVGRATRGPKAGGNTDAEIVTVVDPHLPGFGSIADAFKNWEDVWHERPTGSPAN